MFKLDQRGFSLPIVIGVAALILANSYYFLELNKTSSKTANMTRSEVSEQSEQSRIAGILSDLSVCTNTDNFGGKSLTSLINTPIAFPIRKNAVNVLEVNKSYSADSHAVSSYYLQEDTQVANVQLKYSLVVVYDQTRNAVGSAKKGMVKKTATVKVPLFIETNGSGNITRCYARPTEDSTEKQTAVELAVKYACINGSLATPQSPLAFERSAGATAAISECAHNVSEIACGTGRVSDGMLVNMTNNGISGSENLREVSCNGYSAACQITPVQYLAQSINSSTLSCNDPATGGCPGALMIKNGSSYSCSQPCSTSHQLFQSYNSNGTANCLNTSTYCPAGQYATQIDANGNVVPGGCQYVTYRNRSCPANTFATDIDPGNPSDPFRCVAYTRVKDCPGTYNFATSFTSTTMGCTTNLNY